MKHYWEVDIGLSESANKFDLGWPWRGHFKVMKVKLTRIVLAVAPRPWVHINKNVHHCPINKSASWSLALIDLYGSLQGHTQSLHWMTFTRLYQDHETENRMWRLMPENGNHACHWTLRTPNLILWPWPPSRLIWRLESAIPATAGLLVLRTHGVWGFDALLSNLNFKWDSNGTQNNAL